MNAETERAALDLLYEIRDDVANLTSQLDALKARLTGDAFIPSGALKAELQSARRSIAFDLSKFEARFNDQIADLLSLVVGYHTEFVSNVAPIGCANPRMHSN